MTIQKADIAAASQLCMFGTAENYCGKPAIWHVYDKDGMTMGCEEHVKWWDTHPTIDRHAISGTCGLPGTIWVNSTSEIPGTCVLEGEHDLGFAGKQKLIFS